MPIIRHTQLYKNRLSRELQQGLCFSQPLFFPSPTHTGPADLREPSAGTHLVTPPQPQRTVTVRTRGSPPPRHSELVPPTAQQCLSAHTSGNKRSPPTAPRGAQQPLTAPPNSRESSPARAPNPPPLTSGRAPSRVATPLSRLPPSLSSLSRRRRQSP